MGNKCDPFIADLFYFVMRGTLSDLPKSKCYDLIDMFNDSS